MGTQTSKPLFGDEERRNRFRRPRTPVNISGNNHPASAGDDKRTWPCSNCHATVSNEETRCPYCGGIQVKVKIPRSPMSATKAINSNLLLERLAATPTTPVTRKEMDAGKIQAFLSESTTTSTMDYDEEDEEVEEGKEQDRPTSALSQSSSLSQNFNIPIKRLPSPPFATNATSPVPSIDSLPPSSSSHDRPPDPVALTLEAEQLRSGTPSPQVMFETQAQLVVLQQQQQQQHSPESSVTKRKAPSGFEVPKKKMVLPS